MTLSDKMAIRQVIGSLMKNPLLFLEYTDIYPTDFDIKIARICFIVIKKLYEAGAAVLTPIEVEHEIEQYENSAAIYKKDGGLEFLVKAYEISEPANFDMYYKNLKKYALLRRLKKDNYDISEFYIDDKDIDNPLKAVEIQQHFDSASIEEILNSVEGKYNEIRNEFLNGGKKKGDPAEGIYKLIDDLCKSPNIGPSLEGKIFSSACRGARAGCFFLKSASTSAGKAIPNYTLIPMADGNFKQVKDIQIGDYVIGDDGFPTKIIGRYPQDQPKEIYKVILADGRIAECCEDHLWQYSYASHMKRENRVESVKEILRRTEKLTFKAGKAYRYRIPLNKPVQYKEKELYPSPYVMGALLGDGSFRYTNNQKALSFSSQDEELVAHIAKELGCDYYKNNANNYSWTFRKHKKSYKAPDRQNMWVEEILKNYPSLWQVKSEDKFIPNDYLTGSIEQRMELLRGLLDTDGNIGNSGCVRFTTISEKLKNNIVQLCYSLGLIPTVSEDRRVDKYSATGICFNICIKAPAKLKPSLFSLTRKVKRAEQSIKDRNRYEAVEEIAIVDIQPTGRFTEMTCFTVDNESHLFLMNDFIVTHNTRTSVFDACRLAYPVRWSHNKQTFIEEVDKDGVFREPRKVLFIVTEMDKEELQTIMLAYLSGVDEDHILTGKYELGEMSRVKYAAKIIEKYSGYFIIEEISEPNLTNVEATIKKYVTIDNIKYCFFDYIHSTASMINQFSKNNLGEHTILMMMANQLKQIAKDYNIFIFSATQVNVGAMMDDGEFKNETCIRGSKAVSDKADMGYVMTRVNDKIWNMIQPDLRAACRAGIIDETILNNPDKRPTHILDIYKMRRGRYKNVRIWTNLHLGTGRREDLFMTTSDNQPIGDTIDLFSSAIELPIEWNDKEC